MADLAHTFEQPHERASRLYDLGLTEELIAGAVAVGLAGRKSATPFHPPSYPGFNQWAETHRGLRERLVPLGWEADDSGGLSTVFNASKRIALTVATGTDRTGLPGLPEPTTKYPRGPLTHAVIETNQQLVLPNFPGVVDPETPRQTCVTWYLLFQARHDEVRMEVSCPRSLGDDGRVDSWSERILLPPLDATNTHGPDDSDDDGPTGIIDFPVEPR